MDLLGKNAGIVRDVVERIVPGSPNAIVIVVTNPLDEMTFLAADVSGSPGARDGDGGGARLGPAPRVHRRGARRSRSRVEAMTLGSHGESMVPSPAHATVDGKPLADLVDEATLERLYARTRDAGAEIVGLLEEGERVLRAVGLGREDDRGDRRTDRRAASVCAWCTGQYGIEDVTSACRCAWTAGVTEIVELDLNEDELAALRAAAEGIRAKCADLAGSRSHRSARPHPREAERPAAATVTPPATESHRPARLDTQVLLNWSASCSRTTSSGSSSRAERIRAIGPALHPPKRVGADRASRAAPRTRGRGRSRRRRATATPPRSRAASRSSPRAPRRR